MKTIWKYELNVKDTEDYAMPVGAKLLDVQVQRSTACLWALVDDAAPMGLRRIHIAGTGHDLSRLLPLDTHVATFQLPEMGLVFHIFDGGEVA